MRRVHFTSAPLTTIATGSAGTASSASTTTPTTVSSIAAAISTSSAATSVLVLVQRLHMFFVYVHWLPGLH